MVKMLKPTSPANDSNGKMVNQVGGRQMVRMLKPAGPGICTRGDQNNSAMLFVVLLWYGLPYALFVTQLLSGQKQRGGGV